MGAVDLRVGLGDSGGEPHRRVGGEHGLDLAGFDPVRPRILTCWSVRPRYVRFPSGRRTTRSPVRYMRSPR
ncbi:hypothetical protein SVIOM342S_07838 [Streptomyces violaceorubidus]